MLVFTILLTAIKVESLSLDDSRAERVVTTLADVLGGVPVDYNYNETTSPEGGVRSSPGCPKSDTGYPWIYYREDNNSSGIKCYLAGQPGPCPLGQILFVDDGDLTGYCNCECFKNKKNGGQFCWGTSELREVTYYADVKKCFVLYDQGPCKEGEWLAKVKIKSASKWPLFYSPPSAYTTKCEGRKCPTGKIPVTASEKDSSFRCVFPPSLRTLPSTAWIQSTDCLGIHMRYSSLLQKCVKSYENSSVG